MRYPWAAAVEDVLNTNESVRSLPETAVQDQIFLKAKIQDVLDASHVGLWCQKGCGLQLSLTKKMQFCSYSKEDIHHILIGPLIKQRRSSDIS
ncbi:hypothetical protein D7V91_13955 [bacterium 1xD42-67]|nr:hypothetical protein D7V91_13955 [bacterium 1xD42-67]